MKRKGRKRYMKRNECQYHLCNKKGRFSKCKYCDKGFCKEHKNPSLPGMPNFRSSNSKDREFIENSRKEDNHPCPDYVDYFYEQKELNDDHYGNSLNRLLRMPSYSESKEQKKDIFGSVKKSKQMELPTPTKNDFQQRIRNWLHDSSHPNSRIHLNKFAKDSIIFLVLIAGINIVYNNVLIFNQIEIPLINIGSAFLLILIGLSLKYLIGLYGNLNYFFKGLKNGYKLIIVLFLVLLVVNIYQNQELYVTDLTEKINGINYSYLNPISINLTTNPANTVSSSGNNQETQNSIDIEDFGLNLLSIELGPTRPNYDIEGLEYEIHTLVNTERTTRGLNSLDWDSALSLIARKHSQDMGDRNFFDHVNPNGKDPTDRGIAEGYTCRKDYGDFYTYGIAENIAQDNEAKWMYTDGTVSEYNTQPEIAESIVNGWMNSQGHRENILTETYDKEGVGISFDNGEVFATQNFC